jgi:hypothetical protein
MLAAKLAVSPHRRSTIGPHLGDTDVIEDAAVVFAMRSSASITSH